MLARKPIVPGVLDRPPDRPGRTTVASVLLGLILSLRPAVAAAPPTPRAPSTHESDRSRIESAGDHLAKVIRDGDSALYLSGYAYHWRKTYGPETIAILNEHAWGGGYGKSLTMKDDGVASIALTAFRDSVHEWEFTLGYMREWRWAPFDGELKLGAGLTAFLTSRPDFLDGVPFPGILPQASVALGDVSVVATYVPRIPGPTITPDGLPGMNGNVFYFFSRVTFR